MTGRGTTTRFTGACGAIRYETDAAPRIALHCQCRHCQQRSGTGHGSYVTFPRRAEVTITGEAPPPLLRRQRRASGWSCR